MEPTRETGADDTTGGLGVNPGYALGRLAKVFHTSQTHEDPETRARAEKKIEAWVSIFEGMLSGVLRVGSRTPVVGAPAWATLEVAHGGFATGNLLAGGAIQPHERELLSKLPAPGEGAERIASNTYFLSDAGIAELQRLLKSGCYRVAVPEEGALLVVAWLLGRGDLDSARAVLDEVGPFMSRLRFYPIPDPTPPTVGSVVHLQDVRQTIKDLSAIRVPSDILAQREAIQVWAPVFDRVVELFIETVEGPIPRLRLGADEKPLKGPAGQFVVEGGWPCQLYPDGWQARARAVLEDYRRLRVEHQRCRKPERAERKFARLRGYLDTCIRDPRRLTGRDVGMIRLILASIVAKRGTPGSADWQRVRRQQAAQVAAPTSVDLARLLTERLSAHARDEALDSLDGITRPVTEEEAGRHGLKAGQPVPDYLAKKLRRSLAAPLPVLVEMGVIPSGEVLARVVPRITAQVRAAGIRDVDLRRLYGAIYTAFRRRRSLLLLDLESQVRFEELPWVRVVDAYRQEDLDGREQARQTLEQVVALAVTGFPEKILPNKLLQEVRTLAEGAGLEVPIVDEVAADIFMGDFSEKFVRAAQKAGELLTGTLYERYYGVPYTRVREVDDIKPSRDRAAASQAFVRLCTELAGESERGRCSVARNGKIIEQEQILTTHNLAVLFDALGLTETLRPRLRELAGRCFEWVCRRLQQKTEPRKARLRVVKNTAYAWRQMTFFLSLLPEDAVEEFLAWASGYLGEQRPEFQDRFRPALEGLALSVRGLSPEGRAGEEGGSRRFLGWTTEKHWLHA
jgi:hypothetical protein